MTDASYTEIIVVADRSGSMGGTADGEYTKAQRSTDGVRDLVAKHKALPGRVRFSLYQFDTIHDTVAECAETLDWTCVPRGGTALLDALGKAITETGERLERMPEDQRPGKVIVVTATDGEENSSVDWTLEALRKLITQQKDQYDWDFAFIGADIDAFGDAAKMGMDYDGTIAVAAVSYAAGWDVTSDATLRSRATGGKLAYTADERKKVRDAEKK